MLINVQNNITNSRELQPHDPEKANGTGPDCSVRARSILFLQNQPDVAALQHLDPVGINV